MDENDLVSIVEGASLTDWRAATWLLARRYPERWGIRRPVGDETPEPTADGLDDLTRRREQRRAGVSA